MRNDLPPVWKKDPDDILQYTIDWSSWLDTNDTVSGVTYQVVSRSDGVTIASGDLHVDSSSNTSTQTHVIHSMGFSAIDYQCLCRMTTTNGLQKDLTYFIKVRDA